VMLWAPHFFTFHLKSKKVCTITMCVPPNDISLFTFSYSKCAKRVLKKAKKKL